LKAESITVNFHAKDMKDVFAVPGNIYLNVLKKKINLYKRYSLYINSTEYNKS
jgi:hypothetical protein